MKRNITKSIGLFSNVFLLLSDLVKNMSQQGNVANILGLLQQFEQLQVQQQQQQQKPAQSSQNQMNEQQALLALMAAAAAQQQQSNSGHQSQSASFNPHQIQHQNQMNSASAKISSLNDSSFCDPAILDAAIVSAALPHSNQTSHLPQTHHHQQQQQHTMNNRNFFPRMNSLFHFSIMILYLKVWSDKIYICSITI